jgi:uncharacterized protein YndB with AHSA1/START domain
VITVTMSAVIAADRRRVWSALTRPEQIVAWSPVRTAALAVPAEHPEPNRPARWRCRLRGVPMTLVERPLEVVPAERLRSELRLSLVRVEETVGLADEGDGRTRLSLKLSLPNAIPLVDGLLDRFGVRQLAQQMIDSTLRALRSHFEPPGADAAAPPARSRPRRRRGPAAQPRA